MSSAEIATAAVDATFEIFGISGCVYAPAGGGSAEACTVMRDAADREFGGISDSRVIQRGHVLRVRSSEVPSPLKNGTITAVEADAIAILGATPLKIIADPKTDERDVHRLVWLCRVA